MTEVITWVVDCGDGVCIEREQPSTASKPMPHMVTFDGLKFSGLNRLNPNDSPGPTHAPDEFGSIKGEFSPSREDSGIFAGPIRLIGQAPADDKKMSWDLFRPAEGNAKGEVSPSHQLDTEAIPCYTEFLKPADGEAGGVFESPHGTYLDTQPNDNLLGYPGAGTDALTNYRPEGVSEGVSSPAGYTDIIPALSVDDVTAFISGGGLANGAVHPDTPMDTHPNDNLFAGFINPDSMRPVDFVAKANSGMSGMAQEWFSLGSAVDSVAREGILVKTHCTGYCVDGGSSQQENIFAPVNVLRSDNRF